MKKFVVSMCFILFGVVINTCFSIGSTQTAFAEKQKYTEEQIIQILRDEINSGGKVGWANVNGGISFNDARDTYRAPSGIIYTVCSRTYKNLSQVWFITQVDLNVDKILPVEGYLQANPMYGGLTKLKENQYENYWMTSPSIVKYCNYLREHYHEINGAE